jgi:DNA-binding transcriptional LysR family regulator
MNWDKLRVFHVVAETGSFTGAGRILNLSQSAVSRQIRGLEHSLKLPLFHRHARGLLLTEQGEELHHTVRDIYSKITMTEARLVEIRERPKGPLKITTTVGFGSLWLTEYIGEFLDLYPDISVRLFVTDVELDLTMREADVAIRVTRPTQPELIQRHLFTGHYGIYAAPSYLNRFGAPRTLEQMADHRVISFGSEMPSPFEGYKWLVDEITSVVGDFSPALTVNNLYGMLRSTENGVGIAALPSFLGEGKTNLVRILDRLETPSSDCYFVYPAELRDSQRIGVFREFLLRKVAETAF